MILRELPHGFLVLLALLGGLTACSTDDTPVEPSDDPSDSDNTAFTKFQTVKVSAEDIISGDSYTRTAFELGDNSLKFSWAEGDRIGIFPQSNAEGSQVSLTINAGAGTNTAQFDGNGWALRSDVTYVAYYPYVENASLTQVDFSYKGQAQDGNGSTAHLGAYDWMVTASTTAEEEILNFAFTHLNALAQFTLTLPQAATVTQLTLISNEYIFPQSATLSLAEAPYALQYGDDSSLANQLSMQLSNVGATEDQKTLVLYMMLPPMTWTGHTVSVVLKASDNQIYQGSLVSKTLEAGKAYRFSATLINSTMQATVETPALGETEIN